LVVGLFGWGWLLWGLFAARAFAPLRGIALLIVEILLLARAVHFIAKGRSLRRRYPPLPESVKRNARKWFLTVAAEVAAIVVVVNLANWVQRPDLLISWIAMVVGVHFLPLAKIFRAPALGVIGILMTTWCLLCWALFRSNALVSSAALGTGILLWAASAAALLGARGRSRAAIALS
jgi:hypothetical protein